MRLEYCIGTYRIRIQGSGSPPPCTTEGGRGLIQLELSYKTTTIGLDKYLRPGDVGHPPPLRQRPWLREILVDSRQSMKFSRELGVPAIPPAENKGNTTYASRTKAEAKHQLRSKWESKPLHGKYPQRVKQANVDQNKTHRWLKAAGLKAETEGFLIAAQDQSLPTRWYQHSILNKPDVDPNCRPCGRFDETIDHLISGCPEVAKTEYIHRHNKAALRCRNDGMSMNPRLSPRRTASPFCETCPSTLTGPSQPIGRTCVKEQEG